MDRLEQRLNIARRALASFVRILKEPKSEVIRDASIQRFQYTFEAVWKAVQRRLADKEALEVGSPKGIIRASFQLGLLNERQVDVAMKMADDRNLVVHTYNEALADALYSRLASYASLMNDWLASIS